MVEECTHLFPDGRKCRRIPKRGHKLCSSHSARRRRRHVLEENDAFFTEMRAFVRNLEAMGSEDLFYATTGFLAEIHPLVDRCSSRPHRIAFHRATAALSISADRLVLTARGLHPSSAPPQSQPQPPAPPSAQPLTPEVRAQFQDYEKLLTSGRVFTPAELVQMCESMLSILESNGATTCTFNSNG